LFKQTGRDLTEKVIEAKTAGERIILLTDFLRKRKLETQEDPMSRFANQAFESDGQVNLDNMRDRTGFSVRQFERRYEATAGFTPKYFARMARFQSTKRKYVTGHFTRLSELAQACNYFDQSHFIREFKEFSGLSVGPYFRLVGDKEDQEAKAIREFIVAKDLQRS
jgi:AraC-like DNA-binding protein